MNKKIPVYIANVEQYVEVDGGSTLVEVLDSMDHPLGFSPVCALVNNKIEALGFPLFSPKTVEFLPMESSAGNRTYVRSLCMMLYHAVHTLFPGSRLRIEHSLSNGYFCRIDGNDGTIVMTDDAVRRVGDHMRMLCKAAMPFVRFERRTEEVIDIFRRQGLDDKVMLLSTLQELYTVYYTLNGLSDSYYGPLVSDTSQVSVFSIRLLNGGLLLAGPSGRDVSVPASYRSSAEDVRGIHGLCLLQPDSGNIDCGRTQPESDEGPVAGCYKCLRSASQQSHRGYRS